MAQALKLHAELGSPGRLGITLDVGHCVAVENDTRLVAAAVGPFAAAHLDQHAWRHGVLKCLFLGIPLAVVAGLDRRADAELLRMVAAYADERRAAGRDVPADTVELLRSET